MNSFYRVLFVCTGNICRSPTADAFLRHKVEQAGLSDKIAVDSAGTHGYHVGEPPDSRSIDVLKARGIDMSYLRARKFSPQDFEEFDLILAMDEGHYSAMLSMKPQICRAALEMFTAYAGMEEVKDVPDPYYGGHKEFVYALDLIEKGTEGLLKTVMADEEFKNAG